MKPRLGIVCLIAALLIPNTAQSQSKGQEISDVAHRLSSTITKSGKKTVAVVDFTDLQGTVTEFGRFLAEEFSVALAEDQNGFKVIDRTNLKTILQEHKLASSGIIDPQTARKLGEITGVQALVTGTVTPFGDTLRISVKVLDSETAEIISGVSADMPRSKAIDELLARGVAAGNETTPTGKPLGQEVLTPIAQEHDGLSISIQRCARTAAVIKCFGIVSNQKDKIERLYLNPSSGTDNEGNAARISHSGIRFPASPTDKADLLPKTPTKFLVDVEGLSATAKSVSFQLTVFWGYRMDFVLKDVPIQ